MKETSVCHVSDIEGAIETFFSNRTPFLRLPFIVFTMCSVNDQPSFVSEPTEEVEKASKKAIENVPIVLQKQSSKEKKTKK